MAASDRRGRAPRTIVNGAFTGQRVTGQQRYAAEITARLGARGVELCEPPAAFRGSSVGSWGWSLTALPAITRRDTLLSLTSRAPLWHPRHVVTVHDLFVLTHPEWYSRRFVATHAPHLRAALRTAAHVVAVSGPVADEVRGSGLTRAEVAVAPNAPSEVFTGATIPAPLPTGVPDEGFLLVVGSMDPRKNLPRLLEAYGSLSHDLRRAHPLVVVGGGSSVFRSQDLSLVEGLVMTGYVDDTVLAGLYARARGVVFPSLAEGFGLPLVEAAAAGATLAASDLPVFRWIAGDHAGEVAWFDPTSVDELRESLLRLLSAPRVPSGLGAEVLRRFDWDASAGTVAAVCEAVGAPRR